MHDINPLGTVMHLRELDRLVEPKLRPLRSRRRNTGVTRLGIALVALLRRAVTGRDSWQIASGKQAGTTDHALLSSGP
jgi:hypothetical protein